MCCIFIEQLQQNMAPIECSICHMLFMQKRSLRDHWIVKHTSSDDTEYGEEEEVKENEGEVMNAEVAVGAEVEAEQEVDEGQEAEAEVEEGQEVEAELEEEDDELEEEDEEVDLMDDDV